MTSFLLNNQCKIRYIYDRLRNWELQGGLKDLPCINSCANRISSGYGLDGNYLLFVIFFKLYFYIIFFADFYSEGDDDSFHPSMWEEERQQKCRIHFYFEDVEVGEVSITILSFKSCSSVWKMCGVYLHI